MAASVSAAQKESANALLMGERALALWLQRNSARASSRLF
jgi:hypothetical protein